MFAEVYDPAVTDVSSRFIVTVSVEPATEDSPVPPAIVAVFPLDIVCEDPLSPAKVQDT